MVRAMMKGGRKKLGKPIKCLSCLGNSGNSQKVEISILIRKGHNAWDGEELEGVMVKKDDVLDFNFFVMARQRFLTFKNFNGGTLFTIPSTSEEGDLFDGSHPEYSEYYATTNHGCMFCLNGDFKADFVKDPIFTCDEIIPVSQWKDY